MTTVAGQSLASPAGAGKLQQQVRARIESLSYLPTTAAVAIKFVELGKNPEAEPNDYARVISADSSLSSKLLALANSSWAGVRTKVTTVKMAVNLLGLGTVRALAISYCMTGLHNELHLSPAESENFWEAGLYKAVAAKQFAAILNPKAADEAFVAGLFQDFALAIMYSVARQPYLDLLRDPSSGVEGQLQAERKMFGMDHTEVGRALVQKLELPELFIDTVAFHHNYGTLAEFVENVPVRDGAATAALLPHALNVWSPADVRQLTAFLGEHLPNQPLADFIAIVQTEFEKLYAYFNDGDVAPTQLGDLLVVSAREAADHTTELVGRVNEMLHEAAATGAAVDRRVRDLEEKSRHDALTGTYSRAAFVEAGTDTVAKAARYRLGLTVIYLDLDHFKCINDSLGHAAGDRVLTGSIECIRGALPSGALIGRLGGDEFVILISGLSEDESVQLAGRILSAVRGVALRPAAPQGAPANPAGAARDSGTSEHASLSAGLLYVRPTTQVQKLDNLIKSADELMYAAKKSGGNRLETRSV